MNKLVKTLASVLVTVFFIGILCFALFAFTDIIDSDVFVAALIFQSIGYAALLVLSMLGSTLSQKISMPMLIALAVLTVLYTVSIYILSAVTYLFVSVNLYVLLALVAAFIYFGISTVIVLTGISHIKTLSSRRNS